MVADTVKSLPLPVSTRCLRRCEKIQILVWHSLVLMNLAVPSARAPVFGFQLRYLSPPLLDRSAGEFWRFFSVPLHSEVSA
jgi:hypothetical protein